MCGQGLLGRMAKLAGLSVTVDDEGKYGPGAYSDEMPYFVAGGERMVDFILLPVKDEAGRITFLAPTGTDITDRKRAEEALQQSDRRKDEFLAILAHELRNPLAPIRNILVVDDNKDAAMSLAMMLKFMGNEAKTAHDGLEALDVAGAFRPDLILLDIGMPRLNGYETAKRIREQPWGKGVVLVALTGWGQEEDRRKSDEAGFDSHMVKPVEPAALEKLLANLQADTA